MATLTLMPIGCFKTIQYMLATKVAATYTTGGTSTSGSNIMVPPPSMAAVVHVAIMAGVDYFLTIGHMYTALKGNTAARNL
jgi:hypothetical protein